MNEEERWSELENSVGLIASMVEENIGGEQGHRLMDEVLMPLEEAVYSLRPEPGCEASCMIEGIRETIKQLSCAYAGDDTGADSCTE